VDLLVLLAAGLAVVVLLTAVHYGGGRASTSLALLERLEGHLLDLRFRARGPIDATDRLVMVAIDQPTIDRVGRFPLDRRVMAGALRTLGELGASQVIVDLAFTEHASPEEDEALVDALAHNEADILLGYFFYTGAADAPPAVEPERRAFFEGKALTVAPWAEGAGDILVPQAVHPPLAEVHEAAAGVGYLNLRVEGGGIVRRAQMLMAHEGRIYPTVELLSVAGEWIGLGGAGTPLFLGGSRARPRLSVGPREIVRAGAGTALINYPGPPGVFPTVSLVDVIDAGDGDATAAAELGALVDDRIVLLGPSAVGIWDRRDTPFSASTPAMEVHAAVLDNLLEDRFLQRPPWLQLAEWLVMLLGGMLLVVVLARAPLWAGIGASVAAVGGAMVGDQLLFSHALLWTQPLMFVAEVVILFAGMTALRLRQEAAARRRQEAERAQILDLFGRYVAGPVIQEMVDDPARIRLGGERREISVMFSDIVGFTGISEGLEPEQLASMLNIYLGKVTAAIQEHGGMLDKYIGDGVMALFGAPLEDREHACHALDAALAKKAALAAVNEQLLASGRLDQPLAIGVGVNTGQAVVGNIGSDTRFEYSAIGDEVNLSARLEGLTRQYKVYCIVSQTTRDAAGEGFVFRRLDRVRVKGRDGPVDIHELVGTAADGAPPHVEEYESALTAVHEQRWEDALRGFDGILERWPDDGPARLLRARVEGYRADPPPEEWDGSHAFTSK